MLGALTIAGAVQRWRENIQLKREQAAAPIAPSTNEPSAAGEAAQKGLVKSRTEEGFEEEEPISVSLLRRCSIACQSVKNR